MRLTKGLRISLCCFVVISVGMVLMFQGSAWAKDKGSIADILKNKPAMVRSNLVKPVAGRSATTKGLVRVGKTSAISAAGFKRTALGTGVSPAAGIKGKAITGKATRGGSLLFQIKSGAIKAPKTPTIKGLPGQIDVKLKK